MRQSLELLRISSIPTRCVVVPRLGTHEVSPGDGMINLLRTVHLQQTYHTAVVYARLFSCASAVEIAFSCVHIQGDNCNRLV